jgi:amino acid transporter
MYKNINNILMWNALSYKNSTNGGYGIWLTEAFGEFWGFLVSYLSWMAGVIELAMYPALAYEIVTGPFVPEGTQGFPWIFSFLSKVSYYTT